LINRLGALQSELERSGTDLVVVAAGANLRYLLGYQATAVDRITVLLVSRSLAVMILPDFDEPEFLELTQFKGDVSPWPDNTGPSQAIEIAFDQLGSLPADPTVLIDDDLPFGFLKELLPWLGDRPLGRGSTLLAPMRMLKAPDEIASIAAAADLVSQAIAIGLGEIGTGRTERHVAEEIRRFLIGNGAESADYILVQAGEASAAPHHIASDRTIAAGEPVLIDIAARVDGYFADITQQAFVGPPPDDYLAAYDAVAEAHREAIAATRPGITIQEIDVCANDALERHGFPRDTRTGHGLGLDVHEPPSIVQGNNIQVTQGMVFTIEPGIYISGRFGVRIEDTVVVESGGARPLTAAARPLVVKQ
jgi:Xaa-Pro dipeptidase